LHKNGAVFGCLWAWLVNPSTVPAVTQTKKAAENLPLGNSFAYQKAYTQDEDTSRKNAAASGLARCLRNRMRFGLCQRT